MTPHAADLGNPLAMEAIVGKKNDGKKKALWAGAAAALAAVFAKRRRLDKRSR